MYGSDAVAGVVNFILRRDFDGVQVRAHGSEPAAGSGTTYFGSIMAGKNFAGGRGNVTVQAEYNHEQRVFGSDLPWLRRVRWLHRFRRRRRPCCEPAWQRRLPGPRFRRRIIVAPRSAASAWYRHPERRAANPHCGTGLGGTNGGPSTVGSAFNPANNGIPFNCNFLFNPDGIAGSRDGHARRHGPTGTFLGGNGPTTREDRLLSVFPENKRINVNLLAHYDDQRRVPAVR